MSTSTKSKVSILELVYPPISNQEAVWLQSDSEVEAMLRVSDFYMIASRAEARYADIKIDETAQTISLTFTVGDTFADAVILRLRDLPAFAAHPGDGYWIETGEKMIRLWAGPIGEPGSLVLDWFTTEKLLWERSRGKAGIEGFEKYRDAFTYDLLYVGIAKVGDSFDRLIKHGHKARMDILSNEPQRYPGARVTDETVLFLYEVQPLIITTFEPDHDFTDDDLSGVYDAKRIVADAEKAFVSLLKPQYNVVRFNSYPKGADSLYGSDYARYGYTIGENVTFNTVHGRIRGGRDPVTGFITNEGDSIFVDGDSVRLFVSGVDFPST